MIPLGNGKLTRYAEKIGSMGRGKRKEIIEKGRRGGGKHEGTEWSNG